MCCGVGGGPSDPNELARKCFVSTKGQIRWKGRDNFRVVVKFTGHSVGMYADRWTLIITFPQRLGIPIKFRNEWEIMRQM